MCIPCTVNLICIWVNNLGHYFIILAVIMIVVNLCKIKIIKNILFWLINNFKWFITQYAKHFCCRLKLLKSLNFLILI